ncbi:PREDICTED: DUF21 domain-containing protein At1g55930, chloroplastic-like [Ipomoea nil]|uniref:DUF21 domain-containing protein At1g55930, chloroplastic-like n=1 Tax=Ipomoea nil TaxID=35883 RepID=UPI000900FAC9|nr:PREDICTED: DUF21 domain-containing protein At1g55930, chloroplastic-like [Ipomoea nil]
MVALVAASSSTSGLTERRGISAAVFVKNCSDELTPNLPIKKDIEFMEKRIEDLEKSMKGSNESEEMQKKTGYIVLRAEGIFDVDANTSIDQLSDELEIKMLEDHQYETVSSFVCEAFGYIPRTGESIKVILVRTVHSSRA